MFENLREAAGMAERIHIVADTGLPRVAEGLLVEGAGKQGLTEQALSRGQVAIGLLDPSAHRLPATGADEFPDLAEERGVGLLRPPVGAGGRPGEFESGILRRAVHGRTHGGQHFGHSIAQRPEPDGIEMALGNDMENFAGHADNFMQKAVVWTDQ